MDLRQMLAIIETISKVTEDMDEVTFGTFIAMLCEEKCYQLDTDMVTFTRHLHDAAVRINTEYGKYDKFADVEID